MAETCLHSFLALGAKAKKGWRRGKFEFKQARRGALIGASLGT